MIRIIPLLLLLCVGCASAVETRDPSANCLPDFTPMAKGEVSCEQAGDQCAYRSNPLTGIMSQTELGADDMAWLCTCNADLHYYWCKKAPVAEPVETCESGGAVGEVRAAEENPTGQCSRMAAKKTDTLPRWCCL